MARWVTVWHSELCYNAGVQERGRCGYGIETKRGSGRRVSRADRHAEKLFRDGSVLSYAERYAEECREKSDERRRERFPNLAGFGRSLGVGIATLRTLGEKYPDTYDALLSLLEDEALNAAYYPCASSMLTAAYLKGRLGFGAEERHADKADDAAEAGGVQIIFEHDIGKDGQ